MILSAKVKDGVIVLDDGQKLPDGTSVSVTVVEPVARAADDDEGPTLYERLKNVIGKAQGGPVDGSINVDHYLYGLPKR